MSNVLGYYLMPHPPIVIPDIGKGEEKKIEKTSMACENIGAEIATLRPDTIIVITPHATMFSDAIAISDEERITGDLKQFNCDSVNMNIKIDRKFNEKLNTNCNLEGIPTVLANESLLSMYDYAFKLDHGSMVPLYFVNKHYSEYNLVHITYSSLGNMVLYRFGMEIEKVAEELGRKIVIIASGDLSHKLNETGPYGYSHYGEQFDEEFLEHLENGDMNSLFNMNSTMVKEAAQCGLNSVNILLGAMEGREFKGELLSYEGPFGVGYGVMKFKRENKENSVLELLVKIRDERIKLKLNGTNPYTTLARESLDYYFHHGHKMSVPDDLPEEMLKEKRGVFVSLKKFGNLRGCIGTTEATTSSVAEEIIENAIKAAFHDPRFPKVNDYEMEDLDISVDVLMDAVQSNKEELDPKKYGVIVTKGFKRGLLLPDLEGVDTVDEQLAIACEKADIRNQEGYNIERFEVKRYKEGE